jgi:hypothetical protein
MVLNIKKFLSVAAIVLLAILLAVIFLAVVRVNNPGAARDVWHTEFAFDAGENPQPGQEWILNKDFDMQGRRIRLVSITVNARQGYVFHLQSDDSDATDVNVEIIGHPSISSGGSGSWDGSRIPAWDRAIELDYHLSFLLPKGMLRIVISS